MSVPATDVDVRHVIDQYPRSCRPDDMEFLGAAGGFSGACFWRLTTPQGRLCLRRWPEGHPAPSHLRQIHDVLVQVHQRGLHVLPVPIRTLQGTTFLERAGRLWELSPWLPGEADYATCPSQEKLASAAETLARFHVAASQASPAEGPPQPSPGLQQRFEQLSRLQRRESGLIRRAVDQRSWPGLQARAVALLDLFDTLAPHRAAGLESASRVPVPLQPCIRDIWHDHVLFEGNRVSGIVDFGAMRVESVVGDVTRLFGSLVGDHESQWQVALAAYESIRPLSNSERSLITAFDQSAVLLSGMNWLQWICVERREFAAPEKIFARLDVTIRRLRHLGDRRFSPQGSR